MLFFLMLSLLLICCNTSAEHTSSTNSEDDIFFIYSSLASVKSVMTLSMFLFRLFHHHMSEPQLHLLLVLEHCIHQPEELNSRQHLLINGHGLLSIQPYQSSCESPCFQHTQLLVVLEDMSMSLRGLSLTRNSFAYGIPKDKELFD